MLRLRDGQQHDKHGIFADWTDHRRPGPTEKWIQSDRISSLPQYRNPRAIVWTRIETENETLPTALSHIQDAIDKSRYILDLNDDWDEEGSPGYEEQVWRRAVDFLSSTAVQLWTTSGLVTEAPRITPGPDGSIDVHWRIPNHELLLNVPANPQEPAAYYGDNSRGHIVKGSLDPSAENKWLFVWLTE